MMAGIAAKFKLEPSFGSAEPPQDAGLSGVQWAHQDEVAWFARIGPNRITPVGKGIQLVHVCAVTDADVEGLAFYDSR
jgi:hypothetical protein